MTYVDEREGLSVGAPAGNQSFSANDSTESTSIETFLSRPVRINTFKWLESDIVSIKQTINPWNLWATNAAVQFKLNNYAFVRGNLHVKIVINASPFYYGMMQATYLPLQNFKPSTIFVDPGTRYLIPFSQRPRLVLDPQKQEAGEMVMPFLNQYNMLNNNLASSYTDMGQLDYIIYAPLQSANGVSGQGVSVTTYAWMTDIVLSGASIQYAAQSDEYGTGSISRPASTVAYAASYFEKIPFIGPFATATRIGATAISAIASLFGFTNVPVIADTIPQRPEAFPKLSSSEVGYPIEKLTLDPKNELSIDPRIVGLPDGKDEMMLASLMERESYLTSADWGTGDLTDTILFHSRVNPNLYDVDATDTNVYMTPLAYFSRLFAHWRGDIIFKFKIVASKYHKGRLRLSYDPAGTNALNITNTVNTANVVQTTIFDIGETNEIEFRVPYQQAAQFLKTRTSLANADRGWGTNGAPVSYQYDSSSDNGAIVLRILNILTAPVAASSIRVLVYVRAAYDLEVANPQDLSSNTLSPYAPQSEIFREETCETGIVLGETKHAADHQYTVHFGENIRSLRQLLRRYTYHSSNWFIGTSGGANDNVLLGSKLFYKPPTSPGYISTGTEVANKIVGVGVTPYNFCTLTPLAYSMNCFLAYRGSVNWTFNTIVPDQPLSEVRVVRSNTINGSANYTATSIVGTASNFARALSLKRTTGASGQCITNCFTNAGLNVQCPMYTRAKFQSTNPVNANIGSSVDGSDQDAFLLEFLVKKNIGASPAPIIITSHVGIGTDFSLHFFLNVPTMYSYASNPTAA